MTNFEIKYKKETGREAVIPFGHVGEIYSPLYVAWLEEENERLKGLVKNLDHRLITNGTWEDV